MPTYYGTRCLVCDKTTYATDKICSSNCAAIWRQKVYAQHDHDVRVVASEGVRCTAEGAVLSECMIKATQLLQRGKIEEAKKHLLHGLRLKFDPLR